MSLESFDVISISPNEKYLVRANVETFFDTHEDTSDVMYGQAQLIERETGLVLQTLENHPFSLSANWSSDSRYIAISSNYHWISHANVFDVKNMEYISTPRVDILLEFYNIEIPKQEQYWREWFYFSEWVSPNEVKIAFTIRDIHNSPSFPEYALIGWYVYNLSNRAIYEISYNILNFN